MRTLIGSMAIILAITLAACGGSTDTTTTTPSVDNAVEDVSQAVGTAVEANETPDEVDISTVETAFTVSLDNRAEKITEGKPNQSIETLNMDCQRTAYGKAVCYATTKISVGSYSETKNGAWNVTYDTVDGHPRAFHPR